MHIFILYRFDVSCKIIVDAYAFEQLIASISVGVKDYEQRFRHSFKDDITIDIAHDIF